MSKAERVASTMLEGMVGVLLLSAFWSASPVQAQTTTVVCRSNYNYLNNKEGQNPCLVAAYLQVPCSNDGTNFDVPALVGNQYYDAPGPSDVNYCSCSSVVYSLTSACSQCQGQGNYVSWSYWRGSCPQNMITLAQYPLDIPPGTGVPAWAYQDVSRGDMWNQTLALPQTSSSVAPESTYYGTPTASINYHPSSGGDVATQASTTSATSATASQTSAASTGSSKSNAGPIAGGVVGGIVLLALIGVLVWLLIRRRQNRQNEQNAYYATGDGQMGEASNLPAAVDYGTSYPTSSPTIYSGSGGSPDAPKLYDPDDPSTFPKTPASFAYQSTTLTGTATSTDHTSTPLGRYKGVAEI